MKLKYLILIILTAQILFESKLAGYAHSFESRADIPFKVQMVMANPAPNEWCGAIFKPGDNIPCHTKAANCVQGVRIFSLDKNGAEDKLIASWNWPNCLGLGDLIGDNKPCGNNNWIVFRLKKSGEFKILNWGTDRKEIDNIINNKLSVR